MVMFAMQIEMEEFKGEINQWRYGNNCQESHCI